MQLFVMASSGRVMPSKITTVVAIPPPNDHFLIAKMADRMLGSG